MDQIIFYFLYLSPKKQNVFSVTSVDPREDMKISAWDGNGSCTLVVLMEALTS